MGRPLDATTASHVSDSAVSIAFFLRLDIASDPVVVWTGWGAKAMAGTGDAAMDGQTFDGITHMVGEISAVQDSVGGSQGLDISLPGVDLNSDALRQVVRDKRQWQFKQGWLWMAFLDGNMNVLGKPIRLKSGRIDQMVTSEDDAGGGTVKATLEGQQAYAGEALETRYVETHDLDPADTSNDYVYALANMNPLIQQTGVGSAKTGVGVTMPGAGGGLPNGIARASY